MAGMNETPSGERTCVGFFGVRNVGKSSLVNAVTGQDLSVVSDVRGTTTDTVRKAMEILPLGPVVIVDTPGIDDEGALGEERVRRAKEALRGCNVAVLVIDAAVGPQQADRDLMAVFKAQEIPCIMAANKSDLVSSEATLQATATTPAAETPYGRASDSPFAQSAKASGNHAERIASIVNVSAKTGAGVDALKEEIARVARVAQAAQERPLVRDLLAPGDTLVMVIPIDSSAPKGRIILPQQMVMRDALDAHATCVACQPSELSQTLAAQSTSPRLVVTDSQAFEQVAQIVPREVSLTSFSILMARYKGELAQLVEGARALDAVTDGTRILMAEGCSHHRQCEDIGTVKLPAWIRKHSGANPTFTTVSGREFPEDLSDIDLVVHCGGCTLNPKEMKVRQAMASAQETPIVNYGVAIAHMHGILARALEPLA